MAFSVFRARSTRPAADISVVIPVYYHERFVGDAIRSVLRQTVSAREIICIDDGSTDGSPAVVEAFAREHPEIRFWSRPNRGAHNTLNEGIQAATGSVIAILNSDDVFHDSRLSRCQAVLDADPSISAVFTGLTSIDADGAPLKNPWYDGALAFHRQVGDLGLSLVNGNFLVTTSNLVARRSLFAELGTFDNLRYAHDLDFFLRLVAAGKRVSILSQPLLSYRLHGSNTILEAHQKVKLEWAVLTAFFAWRVAGRELGGQGGDYLNRLLAVLAKHGLTQAVTRTLLHLRGPGAGAQSPGALL